MDLGPLIDRARQRFSPDRFVCVPRVAEWCEHTVPAYRRADGSQQVEQRYTKAELERIAESCNRRIANTGDFAALSYGHPDGDGDIPGYAGPFFVDRLGDVDPVWAIYAYEWHDRDDSDRLRKRPRRSVELRKVGSPDQWFFDPIAALGVDTPRLPLGHAGPPVVERYSLVMASGTNTFVPGVVGADDRKEEERYSMDAPDLSTPDGLKAFVLQVIASIPKLQQLIEESPEPADDATQESEAAVEQDAPVEAIANEGDETQVSDGTDADASIEAPKDAEAETYEGEVTDDEDETKRVPSKVVTEHYSLAKPHGDPFIAALQKEVYSLRQETEDRKRRDRIRDRESALRDLFSGKHFTDAQQRDIEKQCYSLDMSDGQFAAYLKTIGGVAPAKPTSLRIPNGEMPKERAVFNAKEVADMTREYCLTKGVGWDEGRAEILKELNKGGR